MRAGISEESREAVLAIEAAVLPYNDGCGTVADPAGIPLMGTIESGVKDMRAATPQEWRRFGRGASRFVGLLAVVWLVLSSFQRAFPYLASGAALVAQDKFYILAGTKLFGPGDRFKVIAVGNSRTMAGVVPKIFDATAGEGVRIYNFGLPGDPRILPILEAVLDGGNRPDFVLLQAPWDTEQPAPTFWNTLPNDHQIADAVFPFRKLPRDLLFLLADSVHSNPAVVYRRNRAEADSVIRDEGWYFIRSQSHYPNDQLPSGYRLPTDHPDVAAARDLTPRGYEFERLKALAATYKFKVILIPPALRTGEIAPPKPAAGLRALPSAGGFYTLGPDYVNYPPSMFADPVHLNPPGAAVYSEYLAALFRDNIVAGGRAL